MKASLLLMFALACTQRSAAPAPATTVTTTADAAAPRIIYPDHSAVIVEVASDDATREQGLMYRDHMADDRGMIFLFPQAGEYPFWMKNTLIPLDMIWMDADHRIVHIAHDVPPCKADPCPNYPPNAKASSVLELAAGVAAKHHLRDGDVLRFEGMNSIIVR
ncbi:MAG TPA: DUF192 domain-containing protein [Thermoanaerobaculia bacterium]|jgi:uncharacterized membrane protein (UPF0127 family)|nr:DUF192 domain-containing protein [Thermoanaerobaculia bacterium]